MDEVFIVKMPDGEFPARRALIGVLIIHEFRARQPFIEACQWFFCSSTNVSISFRETLPTLETK